MFDRPAAADAHAPAGGLLPGDPTVASPSGGEILLVNEVFHSIQGESTWSGCACVFIRLRGCHLRCRYCDTEYAFRDGGRWSVAALVETACGFGTPLVEVTGGEPLLQRGVHVLISSLCDRGRTVLIETSGACDISPCDPRSIVILDLKTPGSGECERNDLANLDRLRPHDEVKFVITSRADYEWARETILAHRLAERCRAVLLSPVFEQPRGLEILGCEGLPPRSLAAWMLEDRLPVRMQTQLHKAIWDPQTRGV